MPPCYRSGDLYGQTCSCETAHEDGDKTLCLTPTTLTSGLTHSMWTLLRVEVPHPGPVIELALSDLRLSSYVHRASGTVRPRSDDSLQVLTVPLMSLSSSEKAVRGSCPAPTTCGELSPLIPQVQAVSYDPNTAVPCHSSPYKGGR